MYRSGSLERSSVDIIATDENRKILLLKFSKGGIIIITIFFVYEASEH